MRSIPRSINGVGIGPGENPVDIPTPIAYDISAPRQELDQGWGQTKQNNHFVASEPERLLSSARLRRRGEGRSRRAVHGLCTYSLSSTDYERNKITMFCCVSPKTYNLTRECPVLRIIRPDAAAWFCSFRRVEKKSPRVFPWGFLTALDTEMVEHIKCALADLAGLLYSSRGVLSSTFVRKYWVCVIRGVCATEGQLTFWERVNCVKSF